MKLVVWFPGLGSFANVTGNILEFFEKDPDTDILCVSYDSYGAGGFTKAADRLAGALETTIGATWSPTGEEGLQIPIYDQVFYLGHSMGGQVAATLIKDHGHKVDKLVALSSPQSAFWALPYFSLLLHPTHILQDLFSDFGTHPSWPVDVPTLKVYGTLDLLANPASPLLKNFNLEQPNIRIEKINRNTHLSILWSTKAAAEIYSFCTYEETK